MKINLHNTAICRTPVFALDANLEDVWDRLKAYIAYASPAFYELIKDVSFGEHKNLSEKIQFTIWKYFNRAKFRATPYGHFGAFTAVSLKANLASEYLIKVSSDLEVYEYTDWAEIEDQVDLSKVVFLKSNSSVYLSENELRYLKSEKLSFKLSSIEYHELAHSLLLFCNVIHSIEEVKTFLSEKEVNKREIEPFIQQLIDLQLLITNRHPNIIGEDYFNRLKIQKDVEQKYIISGRSVLAGALRIEDLKPLNGLIEILSSCLQPQQSLDLNNFRKQFYKRFENKAVPLLLAMDPEKGVGYGDLAHEISNDVLTERLQGFKDNRSSSILVGINYNQLTRFILNKIFLNEPIDLNELEIGEVPAYSLPTTFSAQLEVIDDSILLKKLGGTSASSLLGRFTLADAQIKETARDLVKIEESYNSDILFFDIAYQSEKAIDNVNRREQIYNLELPILGWSESKQILDLNDLYVTIQGEEIILFSKKYGKRVIPRHASAYNYVRSDLSVFRFLTDLQHQNLITNLTVDLQHLFPDLHHYPRVFYKNIILSTEKWILPKEFIKQSLKEEDLIKQIKQWLKDCGFHSAFKCGTEDQTLTFFTESDEDLKSFLMYSKNRDVMYIEEVFLPSIAKVIDEESKPYNAEFLLSFINPKQVYRPYLQKAQKPVDKSLKQDLLPGENWLYYEIYCHSFRSNEMITQLLRPFVAENKMYIKRWFFIRYNNPADHIRFRLELKDNAYNSILIERFNEQVKPWIRNGNVSDIQLKTYKREIERYGSERMQAVEQCFYMDSELALKLLAKNFEINELYWCSIGLMENALSRSGLNTVQQLDFAKTIAKRFAEEKKVDSSGFKLINKSFLDFMAGSGAYRMNKVILSKRIRVENHIARILKSSPETDRMTLLSDLFHMHVNRLFSKDPRMHELIIYQFLSKILQTKKNHQKHAAEEVSN